MSPADNQAQGKPMLPAISLLRNAQGAQSPPDVGKRGSIATKSEESQASRHRFLPPSEWAIFAHGVGGAKVKDGESQEPARPHTGGWPPRGMPRGLYKDVVIQRTKCYYLFHISSIFRATLLILQIVLGATLTALGPSSFNNSVAITVLGAANTVVAGLLMLMHNSGLPDRFRFDMQEFEHVEDHIRGILEGRLALADEELDQILAESFEMFSQAKSTVAANLPPSYKRLDAKRQPKGATNGVPGSVVPGTGQEAPVNAPNGERSFMT